MGMEQGQYTENGNGGGGGYYDAEFVDYYGGGDSFMIDYGALENYAPAGDEIPYAEYIPGELTGPAFEPYPEYGGGDLFGAYVDYYMNQGMDFYEASAAASESTAEGSIQIPTWEQTPPEVLPELQQYFPLPYVPDYNLWQSPPYIPEFDYYPLPVPPPQPQPQLPGYCPQGTYHPLDNPMICVPFPAPPPSGSTQPPRPPPQTAGAPAPVPLPSARPRPPAPTPAPRPPTGQAPPCPPRQWRNPANGQCEPFPACLLPGQTFDPRVARCVTMGVSPLPAQPGAPPPSPYGEPGGDLKGLPWWVWAALAGLLLLNMSGGEGRTTTVRYKKG